MTPSCKRTVWTSRWKHWKVARWCLSSDPWGRVWVPILCRLYGGYECDRECTVMVMHLCVKLCGNGRIEEGGCGGGG